MTVPLVVLPILLICVWVGGALGSRKNRLGLGVFLGVALNVLGFLIMHFVIRPSKLPRRGWTLGEFSRRVGLATLAGVMIFMSFPFSIEADTNWWPLAWFAMVPFFWTLQGATGRQGFWIGALCGTVTNFGGFWWIGVVLHEFGHLPDAVVWPISLLNAFYQGLAFAIFGLCYARMSKWFAGRAAAGYGVRPPIWMVAALFVVIEWLYPMLFPWFLANGQYRFLPAIQVAELGGVPLATFVMVVFGAALFAVVVSRLKGERLRKREVLLAFGGVAVALIYGVVRVAQVDAEIAEAPKVKLGLVEANIGIFEKQAKHMKPREQALTLHRNLLKHQSMSAEMEAAGVDLVIWPESSFFPLRETYIKRSDDFALAATADGALVALSYAHGAKAPSWVELGKAPGARGVGAARENGWAVAGDAGFIRFGEDRYEVPGKPNLTAIAVIEGAGYSAAEDDASLMAWAVGERGTLVKLPARKVGGPVTPSTMGASGAARAVATAAPGTPIVVPTDTDQRLVAIAMQNSHDGIAVGDGGTLVEINRDKATRVDVGTTEPLRAVIVSGDAAGIAVGAHGTVLMRRDIGRWEKMAIGTSEDLTALALERDGSLWVGGTHGSVFRLSPADASWRAERLPTGADVVALASEGMGQLVAATADGQVFRHTGPAGTSVAAPTWQPLPAPPGRIVSLAGLGYVATLPLPRDIHWVWQAEAPLPTPEDFNANPRIEFSQVSDADLNTIQRGFHAPILLGGLTWEYAKPEDDPDGDGLRMFNTAILLDDDGHVLGTYDKNFLLAFGEFMPFGSTFPELYQMLPMAGRFTPGSEVRVFDWKGYKIGIMICYEDIMANFTGKLADLEPNLIINVTNDAWFGRTPEPHLHLALAIFRAIENRRMLVRSTNTGVSALIDPTGRIVGQTSIDDPETLIGEAPMMSGETLYAMVGNLFATLCLVAVVLPALVVGVRRFRARRTGAATGSAA